MDDTLRQERDEALKLLESVWLWASDKSWIEIIDLVSLLADIRMVLQKHGLLDDKGRPSA